MFKIFNQNNCTEILRKVSFEFQFLHRRIKHFAVCVVSHYTDLESQLISKFDLMLICEFAEDKLFRVGITSPISVDFVTKITLSRFETF